MARLGRGSLCQRPIGGTCRQPAVGSRRDRHSVPGAISSKCAWSAHSRTRWARTTANRCWGKPGRSVPRGTGHRPAAWSELSHRRLRIVCRTATGAHRVTAPLSSRVAQCVVRLGRYPLSRLPIGTLRTDRHDTVSRNLNRAGQGFQRLFAVIAAPQGQRSRFAPVELRRCRPSRCTVEPHNPRATVFTGLEAGHQDVVAG